MSSYILAFPPGTELISANDRVHWTKRAKITKSIRELSREICREQRIPHLQKARIKAVYYAATNHRRDSPNVLFLSSKAAIDGIVDAGVLTDDSDKYVLSLELSRGPGKVTGGQMVLEIEEVS